MRNAARFQERKAAKIQRKEAGFQRKAAIGLFSKKRKNKDTESKKEKVSATIGLFSKKRKRLATSVSFLLGLF